jgi:hypothetical protein
MDIKYRYTKDEMITFKPAPSATFPSHLRVLPSYQLRSLVNKAGGSLQQAGVGSDGQWGRGRQQQGGYSGHGRGSGGGGHQDPRRALGSLAYPSQQSNGGGGQWQRQAPPAMPSQPQLMKTANPFLRGKQKKSKDFVAEVTCSVLAILNKLTPQTYEKLREQLLELPITTAPLLEMLIGQIFDKVVDEAAFSELYVTIAVIIYRPIPRPPPPKKKIFFMPPPPPSPRNHRTGTQSSAQTWIRWDPNVGGTSR